MDTSIFKAYDIRGVYPASLNEEVATRIGKAYACLLQKELKKTQLRIAVGRDMRLSSPQISSALITGLTESGCDVYDIGLVSTPTLYFSVCHLQVDGGVMVSASHNPKQYNGFKMVRAKAVPISGDTGIQVIRELAEKNAFVKSERLGKVSKKDGMLREQISHDLMYVDKKKLKSFTVVADPANSMGALYLEELFRHIPGTLIKMNFLLDGTFPAHEADPLKDETLDELKKKVLAEKADIGIAPDGDGDRIFFVDDKGESVPQAILRGMMAQAFLKNHPGAKICYDIRPGKITEDLILEAGGIPIVTKVGHSLIKEQMMKEGAIFAGESSGHHFLKLKEGYYEVPVIVILKVLERMSEENKPLSEIIKPYKRYVHSGEINREIKDKEKVLRLLQEKYHDGKISTLDGVSIEYPDWWFNVRASNTEPKIRLNLEAKSQELMAKKRDEVLSLLH